MSTIFEMNSVRLVNGNQQYILSSKTIRKKISRLIRLGISKAPFSRRVEQFRAPELKKTASLRVYCLILSSNRSIY